MRVAIFITHPMMISNARYICVGMITIKHINKIKYNINPLPYGGALNNNTMAKKIKNLEIDKFTYEIVMNVGNYQSVRIGGEWSVTDTPTTEQVVSIDSELRQKVAEVVESRKASAQPQPQPQPQPTEEEKKPEPKQTETNRQKRTLKLPLYNKPKSLLTKPLSLCRAIPRNSKQS